MFIKKTKEDIGCVCTYVCVYMWLRGGLRSYVFLPSCLQIVRVKVSKEMLEVGTILI